MRCASVVLCLATAMTLGSACGEPAPATSAVSAPLASPVTDGKVRRDDKWLDVGPRVFHDPKMDLVTRCLLARDDARSHGSEAPLCYDPKRKPERVVTRIAVERDTNMRTAMQRLTSADEGVHFVVDHSGAIYQLLDLAYVARHADAYPEGEVRVIACDAAGEKSLVAALSALYPNATVVTTEAPKGSER